MVLVERDLHRQLAAGAEHPGQAGEQGGVLGQPVQRGVREHEVEARAGVEAGDVLEGEAQAGGREQRGREGRRILAFRTGPGEHHRRAVEAEGAARAQVRMHVPRELAGAAAEVDDVHVGRRLDEGVERDEPLTRRNGAAARWFGGVVDDAWFRA